MRLMGSWALALVSGFAIWFLGVVPAVAQPKTPADFTFEQGKESPGKVTFSHEGHKGAIAKCTGCHTKIFKMKKGTTGPLTMAKMKAGEQCGACHDGKTKVGDKVVMAVSDEKNCATCHKK